MTNLLQETLEDLATHEKNPADVKWVGARNGNIAMTWSEFEKIASVEYSSGFGGQEIANDLVVVGDNWWLERHEYDGSEGWDFQTKPQLAKDYKPYKTVKNGESWASVEEMNRPGGKYNDVA